MKPVALCARGILNSSAADGIVLDLFLGSGSTMIASHETGRVCYGMEIDPKYCDVIIKRYADYAKVDEAAIRATREKAPNSALGGPGSSNRDRVRPIPQGARKRAKNG